MNEWVLDGGKKLFEGLLTTIKIENLRVNLGSWAGVKSGLMDLSRQTIINIFRQKSFVKNQLNC